ncbi:YfiH family protein [Natronospira proteinivora]|uniref:Purine nucleoside phosphorylase n=1 Tax=Natronospira proteinivora TaxID=1807133 RepID=A0ABT1G864_9GAMM|nr:peptidoglycan editing factor PgeF [Natronospira proteinivora]MCP1727485.1 YfiH family protein [Natronospira proteinivora]
MDPAFLQAEWPVSPRVRALTTGRHPENDTGASRGPWQGLNLGGHVGDEPAAVQANRRKLQALAGLPASPQWLKQVHGCRAVRLPQQAPAPEADAAWTDQPDVICAVLTADCLPVFLASRDGACVGIAHAGWRGLAAGVLENLLAAMPESPPGLCAWLGPAIGPGAFQVGEEVRQAFLDQDADCAAAFASDGPGHWRADLYALAQRRLQAAGVTWVGGGDVCTFSDPARFYSHRRQAPCGRMASLIWMTHGA